MTKVFTFSTCFKSQSDIDQLLNRAELIRKRMGELELWCTLVETGGKDLNKPLIQNHRALPIQPAWYQSSYLHSSGSSLTYSSSLTWITLKHVSIHQFFYFVNNNQENSVNIINNSNYPLTGAPTTPRGPTSPGFPRGPCLRKYQD